MESTDEKFANCLKRFEEIKSWMEGLIKAQEQKKAEGVGHEAENKNQK